MKVERIPKYCGGSLRKVYRFYAEDSEGAAHCERIDWIVMLDSGELWHDQATSTSHTSVRAHDCSSGAGGRFASTLSGNLGFSTETDATMYGRNAPCPCGSKYKHCCLRWPARSSPAEAQSLKRRRTSCINSSTASISSFASSCETMRSAS